MCDTSGLISALFDVEYVSDGEGPAIGTSVNDAGLLEDVIKAARLQVNRNAGFGKVLDRVASRIADPENRTAPYLTQTQRGFFLRWLALCGTPRTPREPRPDLLSDPSRMAGDISPGIGPTRRNATFDRNDDMAKTGERRAQDGPRRLPRQLRSQKRCRPRNSRGHCWRRARFSSF
jgi:hypothetical protein